MDNMRYVIYTPAPTTHGRQTWDPIYDWLKDNIGDTIRINAQWDCSSVFNSDGTVTLYFKNKSDYIWYYVVWG